MEKWQKVIAGLNTNHMHIFKPWKKDVQSCIKISMKSIKSCAYKIPTVYTLSYNLRSENDKVKKVTKINSRIISKSHAHLQTMEKTCAKFQKDRCKIVWRVVLTRYPLSKHFHRIWGQKMKKFTKWKKWQQLRQGLYPNNMHIFRPWRKHVQSFKKIGIKLYEELRSQGTPCLYIEVEK